MNQIVPLKNNVLIPVSAPVTRTTLLGTAAWQSTVRKYQTGNLFLGLAKDGAVGQDDEGHVLVAAGARGGKGTSAIVPNLCLWPGSAVVIDPKGENAMVTARRRGTGSVFCHGMRQKVRILDPFNEINHPDDAMADLKAAFNPLDLIDPKREDSLSEAGRIADALVVSENSLDPFWDDAARSLLAGIILHVASSWDFLPEARNLVTVYKLVMEGDANALKILKRQNAKAPKADLPSSYALLAKAMKRNPAFGGAVAHAGAMLEDMERSEKMRVSVMQVLRTNLDFIKEPGMQRCLSRSNFKISDLKTDPKGMSLYLCLPQRYMQPHFRWLRMMTTLIIGEMERVAHQPKCGHRVLMVLDEFAGLQRMKVIENAAAQIAGFGVKMMFVVQTLAQLKHTYKDNWETLLANCSTKLFFCNDDHFTRDYVSKLIGDCEVVRTVSSLNETRGMSCSSALSRNASESRNASFGSTNNVSNSFGFSSGISESSSFSFNQSSSFNASETVHKRALITPDEVGRLFGDRENPKMLVLLSGQQPLTLQRFVYFRHPWLRGFYDINRDHPAPLTLDVLKGVLAQEKAEEEKRKRAMEEKAIAAQNERKQAADEYNRKEAASMRREQIISLVLEGLQWIFILGALLFVYYRFFPVGMRSGGPLRMCANRRVSHVPGSRGFLRVQQRNVLPSRPVRASPGGRCARRSLRLRVPSPSCGRECPRCAGGSARRFPVVPVCGWRGSFFAPVASVFGFGDFADHRAPGQRIGVELEQQALAVAVGPSGPDPGPAGFVGFADHLPDDVRGTFGFVCVVHGDLRFQSWPGTTPGLMGTKKT
ncbi:MAG: type IV secretory system conjugative DNA transfer family protein [Afipia sp.]|nr:type IV secretory system conjugative DNA transfer family protein [Afipia sp.]